MQDPLKFAWSMAVVTLGMVAGLAYAVAAERFGDGSGASIPHFTGLVAFFAVLTVVALSRARRTR